MVNNLDIMPYRGKNKANIPSMVEFISFVYLNRYKYNTDKMESVTSKENTFWTFITRSIGTPITLFNVMAKMHCTIIQE